jgi:ABC-2 type transport system ATP-binding protein
MSWHRAGGDDRRHARHKPRSKARRPDETAEERHVGETTGGAAVPTEATTHDAVVNVRSLTKRYGELTAVDDLTFSLDAGTITGFLGPNGAGKSTTLRLLVGLAAPTAGEALVFGRHYRELDDPTRRIGAVLESGDFHPARSGRDHLRILALAAGIPRNRVEEVLALVELGKDAARPVRGYSLGMRQRLGLAGALLGAPELLILDEPANGLDPEGIAWLRGFLRRFAEQGGTVLVSSHVLTEVAQTADRVVIIHRGRLVAAERLDGLTASGRTLEDVYLHLTAGEAA